MRDILRELQAFNAVAVGTKANLVLPVGGPTYYGIFIRYLHTASTAATEAVFTADVESIKVKLNGEPLWDISGGDLVDLNNYYGIPMANGYFPLLFARPEFADPAEELRFALGTVGLRQLTVELKLKAASTAAPELDAWAPILVGREEPVGQIIRVRKTVQSAEAAAGIREIHDLPVVGPEPGRGLKALHINSALITDHDILMNGATVSEGPENLVNLWGDIKAFQTVSRNPVAGYHHVDFAGNRYSGIIPTQNVADFRLKLTFSGAQAAYDVIHEEVMGTPGV